MSWLHEKQDLARDVIGLLYEKGMIRTWYRDNPSGWRLISGLYSPLYIQLRPLISHPDVFQKVCSAMARLIQEEVPEVNKVVGIAMAGVPLAAGISLQGIPAAFTRKIEGVKSIEALHAAISDYGEHSMLEGELNAGDNIALVDDLVTKFDSKLVAMEQVKLELIKRHLENVSHKTVLVVLDREQGGTSTAQKAELKLVSLIQFKTSGLPLLKEVMRDDEWRVISDYLKNPEKYQDEKLQEKLKGLAPKR